MNLEAISILVGSNEDTIGAKLYNGDIVREVSTESLVERSGDTKLRNAIIDKNGFVRARKGNLQKEFIRTVYNTIEYKDILAVKKLLSMKTISVYHGNKDGSLIPAYNYGKSNNDYGVGFYTTPDKELAKEWAWSMYGHGDTGYVHTFSISVQGLNILDLTRRDSLHWIAELLYNRRINIDPTENTPVSRNIKRFISKYKLNTSIYDIIIGYRADDSYFRYAEAFAYGNLYKETLERVLRLGELGIQVCFKSNRAFQKLQKVNVESVPIKYKTRYKDRDDRARAAYYDEIKKSVKKEQVITDFI